jgi:2-keto-4-pentenoate hydratase/2-oxohepta-3-ene-1,7-dioic acid hydratase in catechol pathway
MRLVTYDAGQGPRVGILQGDAVLDAGFDGDMIAFIEAGAPVSSQTPVENARLLSPLRPRSMRDFLAFEGHLKNAFRRLARPIPDEWYEVPAFYRGMPDTVIGPGETVPYPPYAEKLDHELELAAIIGRRGKDVPREERPLGPRYPGSRVASGDGPFEGEGLGRLERLGPLHSHGRRGGCE